MTDQRFSLDRCYKKGNMGNRHLGKDTILSLKPLFWIWLHDWWLHDWYLASSGLKCKIIMQLRQWQIHDDLWPINDLFYSLNQLNQSSSVFHWLNSLSTTFIMWQVHAMNYWIQKGNNSPIDNCPRWWIVLTALTWVNLGWRCVWYMIYICKQPRAFPVSNQIHLWDSI